MNTTSDLTDTVVVERVFTAPVGRVWTVAALLLPASAFRLTKGQLRYHFTPSMAGGKHKRGFCPECGSRLTGGESDERSTGFIGITAGSLDDPSWFRPQMDFFVSDAPPWDQMDPAIPKYELYPPR